MNEEQRKDIAIFRFGIIAPAVTQTYDKSLSLKNFFKAAAKKVYVNPRGEDIKVTASTLERWYYNYKEHGIDALVPKRRIDTGKSRKLDDDMKAQISFLKTEYPRIPATLIYQKLVDNETIQRGDISLSTINRYINQLKQEASISNNKDMRRYEREHINEVWCGDSSVGPYLIVDGKKKKTYIIAIIDDASRMIVGIGIFFNDNYINLMSVIKTAVTRFGVPKILNFDNGPNYRCKQMSLLAARIGSIIHFNAPYTPTGKAKIERWFRSLKDHWMSQLDMKSFENIDQLYSSLLNYVNQYNKKIHSSLNGKTPENRYFEESMLIRRLDDSTIETSFLLEYERKVSADNVITINDVEYEVPYIYAKQKITLRYSVDLKQVYVVDKATGDLTEIKLLNKHENSHIKREKVKLTNWEE